MFIGIWEKRESIEIRSTWDGYLYSALKYKIFRYLDRKNELNFSMAEVLREAGEPDEILSFEELYQLLDETVNNLPPQCKTIFEKKYYENKRSQDIAQEMGLSPETIKTHLKRGHKIIRMRMKDAMAGFMFLY